MKNFGEFLKKHLVLILCGVVAVAALGAGIYFMVTNEPPAEPDPGSQTTDSTGDLDLDTDLGFGDMGSGIVVVPGGDEPSGDIVPVTPNDKDETPNSGDKDEPAGDGNGNQTPPDSGSNESGTIDMSGSVVENPF